MGKICPLMGPKMSAFWLVFQSITLNLVNNFSMVMSVWGVIFLGLLGVFFYIQAVTLFPDLHFSENEQGAGKVPTT